MKFKCIAFGFCSAPTVARTDYAVYQEKKSKLFFCHNFVKCSRNLIIFGKKMVKAIILDKVHSFFTLPNLCQRTIVFQIVA